jgi:hypothetical protein
VAGVVVNSEQMEVQNICVNLKEFQQMKFKKNANRAATDLRKNFLPWKISWHSYLSNSAYYPFCYLEVYYSILRWYVYINYRWTLSGKISVYMFKNTLWMTFDFKAQAKIKPRYTAVSLLYSRETVPLKWQCSI